VPDSDKAKLHPGRRCANGGAGPDSSAGAVVRYNLDFDRPGRRCFV